ncbi:alpha/beta hydrolase [Burkholderia ambifaria]|uniref:Dienelactone hydrolase domain protein n=1 Tax=Burkholderia ambifaria MEX-5 TaxID=396597 RepID=B1T4J6_9BURK|nr:alpha/beta hydrolase [Burkholderia ambifaria]EDT41516.1 dienelactone hydrolase domain protein [Burkholderia ambifaria MEX-5]
MKIFVTFDSAGVKLAGHLYLQPAEAGILRPAIVVGHPGAGVKEQAAGLYAQHLARQGFIALAFDAAHQGESDGEPRGLEDPAHRIEDFKAAVSFLTTRENVDPDRIGALGICASGGYLIPAAATDPRIKAVATVSAADISLQFRFGADRRQNPAIFQSMLDAAAAARTAEANGEGVGVFQIFPTEAQARVSDRHVFEGWEYYCSARAHHPRSATFFTWNSVDRIAHFDAFRLIDAIAPRPLLMIAGTEAATSWMSSDAFANAQEPKELFWVEGATHVALYDTVPYVDAAVAKLNDFFSEKLGGPATA